MPVYNFYCEKCRKEFEEIVKMSQEYTQCPACRSISQRTHHDLCSPAQIEIGVGGVYRGKYSERQYE